MKINIILMKTFPNLLTFHFIPTFPRLCNIRFICTHRKSHANNGKTDSTPRIVTLFTDLLVSLIVEEAFREQVAFFSRE